MNPMDLSELSPKAMRAWLQDALLERAALPRLTPDEPAHVAIVRLAAGLSALSHARLVDGCASLVREFAAKGAQSDEYVEGLLYVAVDLRKERRVADEIIAELSGMVERVDLDGERKRSVLHALNMLGAVLPPEFWYARLAEDPSMFASAALKALLASYWRAGIALLPALPARPALFDAAASILEQALGRLRPEDRTPCIRELTEVLPRCAPALREVLDEVLEPYMPRAPHAPARSSRLSEALAGPRFARFSHAPRSARLVDVRAAIPVAA